jgi:phenylalanyl-tRNA synthetase beta chain
MKSHYKFLLNQKTEKKIEYKNLKLTSSLTSFSTYIIHLENFQETKTPGWISKKLKNGGLEVSDALLENLINLNILEWGQNTNLLNSNGTEFQLIRLSESEELITDDDNQCLLEKGTIVLKDNDNKIVSVLGLLNLKQTIKNSNSFYLEFTFYDIHQNNLNLKTINTNLSYRYLRRLFLTSFKISIQRLLTLLEIYTNTTVSAVDKVISSDMLTVKSNKILYLKKNSAKKILNLDRYDLDIFLQAGFKVVGKTNNKLYFSIPSCRNDINREIDLIEEYSRFIGYKNFNKIKPVKQLKYSKNSQKSLNIIKQFFLNYGFNEILTNSIYDNLKREKESISITNPLNNELAILRTSLLPNLIKTFEINLRSNVNNQKFFEIGRVFKKYNAKILEQDKISGIFNLDIQKNNTNAFLEYFQAKGLIENLLQNFDYKNLEFVKISKNLDYYHPTRSFFVKSNGVILGTFGEISPYYEKLGNLKQKIYLFEFNLNSFQNWRTNAPIISYANYSKYPSITKDLSIEINKNVNFKQLKTTLIEDINYLQSVSFFDVYYDGKKENLVNLSIRLKFQSENETLLTEVVEAEVEKVTKNLKQKFEINI